ncbi:MAG: DUF1461 domain-containing protein [Defluviitaleaceae bacterium]|nr:DUF1461 domain-containing protein [Defluviitaleaceae bacterium]
MLKWVMGYVAALCVLVLVVSQSIIMPTFFMPIFRWQYNRTYNGQALTEIIGASHEDLIYVTSELLDYMRGRRESLDGISIYVESRRQPGQNFFTDEPEIRHMRDVRILYERLFMARNIAFFLLAAIVLAMVYIKQNPFIVLARCSREILAGFLALAALLAGIVAIDFNRAWDMFHRIFFRGDAYYYWRLTPFQDLMINMFHTPIDLFAIIAIIVGVLIAFFSGAIILLSTLYLRSVSRTPGFNKL